MRDGAWCRPLADGRGVLALHEFIEGACDDWGRWHARKESQPGFLGELGGEVARLHNVLRHAPIPGDSSLPLDLPPIQFDRLRAQERQWGRDLDCLSSFRRSSPAVRQLVELRPRIAESWRKVRAAIEPRLKRLPRQIVHGDVSPVNLVLRPDGRWAFIDWDCTHVGWRVYDALGDVLNRPPGDRPDLNVFRADHVADYLAGYEAEVDEPLTDDERALIPAFCMARQLEDLRQRVRALSELDASRHTEYATLIVRRVEMLDQIVLGERVRH
jgi:Ser/Thr protein kinase RdoA (MazF antagonist)